ncbi:MAG: sigma 54-interacting transcriptional regulator [Proteobacteria bacterium]|nr:sigma 54-interacting transcriptional regulator [Pseudomonadota bacterium]
MRDKEIIAPLVPSGGPPPSETEELPEGDGVLVLSPRGRILSANLQIERIFGRAIEHGRSLRPGDLFAAESKPQAELALREALQGGHSRSAIPAEVRLGEDTPVPVFYSVTPLRGEDGLVAGLVLTFREQNRVPETMNWNGPGGFQYDALFENLAEGVFTINNRWRITSFNLRAQDLTGFTRDEVLGRYCWDVFQSDLCQTGCPLRSTLDTGVIRMDQDVRIVGKHGQRLIILVNTSVIKDKRDMIVGAVETFRPLSAADPFMGLAGSEAGEVSIIGQSRALKKILDMLPDVAASEASVVLEGESGTGKELFARAIHAGSPRAEGPFVAVNCSALAETLLESELFGHEKAAFTGAINSKVGRFELARGGTLFLDEVGEIKPDIQIKLLRVLEERIFERVGGTRPIKMDARIVAATNRNLAQDVRRGRFREDLFYRLLTVPLSLPPLRERLDDLQALVNHFVARFNRRYQKKVRGVDLKAMERFRRYHWPGNVRELERILEYAFVFVKGPIITPAHLPDLDLSDRPGPGPGMLDSPEHWGDEARAIRRALEKAGGRREEAARLLGISRSSLWRKMKAHQLF